MEQPPTILWHPSLYYSPSVTVHIYVDSDKHVTTFFGNKHYGQVKIGQRDWRVAYNSRYRVGNLDKCYPIPFTVLTMASVQGGDACFSARQFQDM